MMLGIPARLSDYNRAHTPPRPVELPSDDGILRVLAKARTETALKSDEKELVEIFAAWRDMVWEREDRNLRTIQLLLGCVRWLEERANGELTAESIAVRKHLKAQFGRYPPKEITNKTINGDALALSQDLGLLPAVLRWGEQKPK